jgi:VWFA-related protein
MKCRPSAFTAICLLVIWHPSAVLSYSQDKKPAQTDQAQDSVKVFVEEVRIPILAQDESGRFDPTVSINDLTLKENGIVQQLKSVYRIPANVLLLLDTGGEQNVAKDVRVTRAAALGLVSTLWKDDQVAVMQVNNRVELLQDWTTSKGELIKSLNHKLFRDKRTVLEKGLLAAADYFKTIPSRNSHLVLISDGVGRGGIQPDLDEAFKYLVAANITVHVISYTSLGLKTKSPSPTRPRVKSAVDKHLIDALPSTRFKGDPTPDLKTHMSTKGGVVVDLDRLLRRNGIKGALAQREQEFSAISEETGGSLALPTSADELVHQASEVARRIDSQYVITYKPTRPLNSSTEKEYRMVDVISRRVGLMVHARRGYVARIPG